MCTSTHLQRCVSQIGGAGAGFVKWGENLGQTMNGGNFVAKQTTTPTSFAKKSPPLDASNAFLH
jgi:hypothetical protein